MGRCRNCGGKTKYSHNNAWCFLCFHFNYKTPRFYIALILTFIWEIFISVPDKNSIKTMLMSALFKETGFIWFLIGKITIEIIILLASFLAISLSLYYFFKKFD